MNRQFWKSGVWKNIWDAVKGEVTLTTNLRTIHSSWMLWLVAVVFTVITSPPAMMNLYGRPGSVFIIAGIIIFAAVVGEKWLGKHIANTYFNEIRTNETHTLNKLDVWVARVSLFIIAIILFMDVMSVASESYSWIYLVSVFLVVITTLLLTLPIVKLKNKKEEK